MSVLEPAIGTGVERTRVRDMELARLVILKGDIGSA